MRFKKWLVGLLALAMVGVGGVTARADTDYDNALKTAPQGIALDNIFTPGETDANQAKVVDTTNPDITGTQAVMVTNAKNQFGTIWSTDDNAFELDKDETVSMWIYFGNRGKKAADGMAFVLQNDSRGLVATPTYGKKVAGETLGVWGVDNNNKQTDTNELAKLAIQNSWALEFDTHLNTSKTYSNAGDADSFDSGRTGPHIASNYPGEANTYEFVKTTTGIWPAVFTAYYATQRHRGLIEGGSDYTMLANGAWHHVTLNWNATEETMTYTFDDKDPATGQDQTGTSQQVSVDPKIIDPDNTGKVRWGFTGATGDDYANNLVIFEGVPGLVDVSATTKLTDLTTDQTVNDGDAILGQDELQLDYVLKYHGGKQSWKDVVAKLTLPDKVAFKSGTVTYANGQTEDITSDDIADQKLTHQLKTALSSDNPTATISLKGQAADEKDVTQVPSVASTFSAVNGVATTDTSHFVLNPKLDIGLYRISSKEVTIDAGETTTIQGQVLVPEGITLTNKDLVVHPTVNGQKQDTYTIEDPDDEASGKVLFTPKAADLKAGKNTVDIYVQDIYGNKSSSFTVTINVRGGLTFGTVASNSSFQATTLTGQQQDIKRTNNWQVKISDTRQAGSTWQLQVAATPFTSSDGKQLAGSLVYRDGGSTTSINTSPVTISNGQASGDGDLTDVVDDWDDKTGLELNVNSNAVEGDYSTDITWTLSDTPS
ncbi:lectin-like domain-containing protein [Levilactobacillus spicheri]